jgi:hypothetical protein
MENLFFSYGDTVWLYCCSAKLINLYRNEHRIDVSAGYSDPAVATGISDLLDGARGGRGVEYPPVSMDTGDEGNVTSEWGNNQPGVERV